MIVSFRSFHWQFLSHECASFQRVPCAWPEEAGPAGQGCSQLGQQSSAWAVLGRLWQQQQHPCSCWREEQHISEELMPEPTVGSTGTGSCAVFKVCLLPGASLDKSNKHNCSLPVKVPVRLIRLWLRDLKTHSFLRYLCQRITPHTNYQSPLVILDRCKIFTAAFK